MATLFYCSQLTTASPQDVFENTQGSGSVSVEMEAYQDPDKDDDDMVR